MRLVAVVGPTAAGKSDLALDLAEGLGGPDAVEIINADSMQVYRGMDIGTAKLPMSLRRGIEHHLLDVWPVTHPVTVSDFQSLGRQIVRDIHARGKTAMLVGGSGLYVKSVIDDLQFPGTDERIRATLETELDQSGSAVLHARLAQLDPEAAARIPAANGRRVVRALEVIELTGKPFTATLPNAAEGGLEHFSAIQVGVDRAVAALADRIEMRVELMWRAGLVDEVRGLMAEGIEQGRTARRALGYGQALAFLHGELTEQQAIEQTVTSTRRFARRQRSWFRRDPRINWYDAADPGLLEAALSTILA